jgi:uncharacterized RDD family membrane protein YckC
MSAERHCPQCRTPLPADAPEGLCPACLVKAGLADQSIEPSNATSGNTTSTGRSNSISHVDLADARTLAPRPAAELRAVMPERLRAGELFGNYNIVRRLGMGGMGTVFEAEEQPDGRRLALKVLNHSFDSPEARLRFLREGRLAAAINHPNSVYVYGTEEIAGAPAITMELVRGGTLEDRVRSRGPLQLGEAVDAMLQVVDGLEAASALGVLHRDVKPSNCFIDADGTVKVGDFGLSISTFDRSDSQLTETGTFMGTPAFASPEQFRGEMLDLRSDIYSLGATLFYLLTATTPFQAPDLIRLMVAVLEQPAPTPARLRPGIPPKLAQVITRCLAKSKYDRYATYSELRTALEPFNSVVPVPARLVPRLAAGLIDCFLLSACSLLPFQARTVSAQELDPRLWVQLLWYSCSVIIGLAYFVIPEFLWGASLGKAICRLRVVGLDHQSPTLVRSLGRALIFLLVPVGLAMAMFPRIIEHGQWWKFVIVNLFPFLPFILFMTARRKNGMAALQDLATGTKVVMKPERQSRARTQHQSESIVGNRDETRRIGPYLVIKTLEQRVGEEILLGYDTRLLRKVWIRQCESGAALPRRVVGISRDTRIRWLTGRTADGRSWDAFEAVEGQPLMNLLRTPLGWHVVRYWLYDLAGELQAACAEQTLPDSLTLDRIWITSDGRAKLMDFRAWGIKTDLPPAESQAGAGLDSARAFLIQVASSALQGRVVTPEEAISRPANAVLPLHARMFLNQLPAATDLGHVADQLRPLLVTRATITRSRRLALAAACCLLPVALSGDSVYTFVTKPDYFYPTARIEGMRRVLERLDSIEHLEQPNAQQREERQQLETFLRSPNSNDSFSTHQWEQELYGKAFLSLAQQSRWMETRGHHFSDFDEFTNAFQPYRKSIQPQQPRDRLASSFVPRSMLLALGIGYAIVIVFSFCGAALFRGLMVHALGMVIVDERGRPASRVRVLVRTLAVWSPLLVIPFLLPVPDHLWSITFLTIIFFAAAAWSVITPSRSVPDQVARTWLVPR